MKKHFEKLSASADFFRFSFVQKIDDAIKKIDRPYFLNWAWMSSITSLAVMEKPINFRSHKTRLFANSLLLFSRYWMALLS